MRTDFVASFVLISLLSIHTFAMNNQPVTTAAVDPLFASDATQSSTDSNLEAPANRWELWSTWRRLRHRLQRHRDQLYTWLEYREAGVPDRHPNDYHMQHPET